MLWEPSQKEERMEGHLRRPTGNLKFFVNSPCQEEFGKTC